MGNRRTMPWRIDHPDRIIELHPDVGCDFHPECLSCPAPMCKYEDTVAFHEWQRQELAKQIIEAMKGGGSKSEVCASFGVDPRNFNRWLRIYPVLTLK